MAASKTKTKEDRKDADTPEQVEKTVTVQGLKVTIDTSVMDDLDVIEAMNSMESGRNQFAIVDVFQFVFGDEQYKKIKDHLTKKHGRAKIKDMIEFFKAALKKAAPNS